MEGLQDLCHNVRNLILIGRSLLQRVEKHQLEIASLQGKLAHRLGELESTLEIFIEKGGTKDEVRENKHH